MTISSQDIQKNYYHNDKKVDTWLLTSQWKGMWRSEDTCSDTTWTVLVVFLRACYTNAHIIKNLQRLIFNWWKWYGPPSVIYPVGIF